MTVPACLSVTEAAERRGSIVAFVSPLTATKACNSLSLKMVLRFAVAMLLGIGSAGAQQNASTVKALRERLLGKNSEMDPRVPPSTSPGQGTQVWVQFRIFKVLGVDLQSGRLRFKAWRRTRWFDDRLTWNPVSAWLPCPKAAQDSSPLVCIVRRISTISTRCSSIREVLRPQTWTTTCGSRT